MKKRNIIEVLISNPSAVQYKIRSQYWFIFGEKPNKAKKIIHNNENFKSVAEEISSLHGEYSILHVSKNHKKINAYRGITSSFDIFYCKNPENQTIIVGDHFRDVLSQLPVSERSISEPATVDHLLFGTRPRGTYVEKVNRLAHGELLHWKIGDGPEVDLFDTLTVGGSLNASRAMAQLDQYFTESINKSRFEGSVATMLSGGVDSTLIHSYINTDATVSAAFDSPEFQSEVEYAAEASRLLGSDHQLIELAEEEFCEHVERTTKAMGHPLQHLQAPLMYATFSETPHKTYLNGQLADGIFGTEVAVNSFIASYLGKITHILPTKSSVIYNIKNVYEKLQLPSTHPDGLAMNFVVHGDQRKVAEIFGHDVVRERKHRRLQYTQRRVPISTGPGYENHVHLGHFIDFFQDNTVTPWRHAAHALGKAMYTPFAGRKVIETILKVSPGERYSRFAWPPQNDPRRIVKNKYLLKDLLEERVPKYETQKRKGSSGLPVKRYFEGGPLRDAFCKYSIPDFIPKNKRSLIMQEGGHISWYALSYAIWRDRVLKNESIDIFGSTTKINFKLDNK